MKIFEFFDNLLTPEKSRVSTVFRKASEPQPEHATIIDKGHSWIERIIRDEYEMMKSHENNNAFLLYFHTGQVFPRGQRVTQDDIEATSLAKTMRAILNRDDLAIVLDLRQSKDFESQWPFKPGTVQTMDFFKDVGALMPKQFQFFRMNMPNYKPSVEFNYPDDPTYYGA